MAAKRGPKPMPSSMVRRYRLGLAVNGPEAEEFTKAAARDRFRNLSPWLRHLAKKRAREQNESNGGK